MQPQARLGHGYCKRPALALPVSLHFSNLLYGAPERRNLGKERVI